MKTRILLKKIALGLIGLAFVALTGLTLFQHRQIRGLKEDPPGPTAAMAPPAAGVTTVPGSADVKQGPVSRDDTRLRSPDAETLNYQLQAAEEELDMVHEDLNRELDRKDELAKQRRELLKQQLQAPAFKKFMRENIDAQIADFIEAFHISPEDAEAFAEILLAERMASQALHIDAEEITRPTEADRERFAQLSRDQDEEYKGQEVALLGEDLFQEYETYLRRWFIEAYEVGSFAEALDPAQALTEAQEEALVEALFEAQETMIEENTDKIEAAKASYTFPSEYYTRERMDRTVDYMTRRKETLMKTARGTLSDAQMKQLGTYLDQDLERTVTNMKMTALEYGYDYAPEADTGTPE